MTVTIGRRELLAALGGAAAWPLAARAQQRPGLKMLRNFHWLGDPTKTVFEFLHTNRQGWQVRIGKMSFFSCQQGVFREAPCRGEKALGSRFDTGSIEEVVCDILAETRGCFKYVVTPNVHRMVRLLEDPATMQPLYERAWRVFCDSRVLSRLACSAVCACPSLQAVI